MSYAAAGVTVRAGGVTILDEVSIEVRPGEVVAMAGPNGAGKSTLLAVLAGDRRADGGRVVLDGRTPVEIGGARLARRRAVMLTTGEVAFGYSAREVVTLGRLPIHGGAPADPDRAIVEELLSAVDGMALADRAFASLSTGERQRVRLAGALAQLARPDDGSGWEHTEARYLLLDEPTSSQDPAHQHIVMRLVRAAADDGLGVIVVLHDLNLAAAYADRVVLMRAGRAMNDGPPAQVLRPELLLTVFDMPMLVIPHPELEHPMIVADPRPRPPGP
jgi:iron complex transport system ATP-binding protein